jgi:hypothetical protein
MSLTSTEATDTLSTSVFPPSSNPESPGSKSVLRRRMHALEGSRSEMVAAASMPTTRRVELTEGNLDVHSREAPINSPETDFGFETNSMRSSPAVEVEPVLDNGNANHEYHEKLPKRENNSSPIPTPIPHPHPVYSSESTARSTRAWYEFDLSVIVALASPIGKWLTGGDHVRNLLLILLLVFYLHQIIESTYFSPSFLLCQIFKYHQFLGLSTIIHVLAGDPTHEMNPRIPTANSHLPSFARSRYFSFPSPSSPPSSGPSFYATSLQPSPALTPFPGSVPVCSSSPPACVHGDTWPSASINVPMNYMTSSIIPRPLTKPKSRSSKCAHKSPSSKNWL